MLTLVPPKFFVTKFWWSWGGSNSWPPACKAGALPAELQPQKILLKFFGPEATLKIWSRPKDLTDKMVGPRGFEPLTPVLSGLCSNQLSYGPEIECVITLCNALIHYTLHNISEAISIDKKSSSLSNYPCWFASRIKSQGLIRPYNLCRPSDFISCGLIKFIEIAKLQKTPWKIF